MRRGIYFSLSFRNQDIFFIELDGIDSRGEFEKSIDAVHESLRNQSRAERTLIHLEGTKLDRARTDLLVALICVHKDKFSRLGFVGIHGLAALRFRARVKRECDIPCVIQNDYEKAKELVVSERE